MRFKDIYSGDPGLVIEPEEYLGGIPVFKPKWEDFKDFYKFNKAINKYGMQSGIVKVVPPKEWKEYLLGSYSKPNLESIKIRSPIVQHINGDSGGVYTQHNVERPRTYNVLQWKELSQMPNHQPPALRSRNRGHTEDTKKNNNRICQTESRKVLGIAESNEDSEHCESIYNIDTSQFTPERCAELERVYWRSITYAAPMFGADMVGSLFPEKVKSWNVAHLPNILDLMDNKVPGVNDAYIYAGLWKATFAWHLEDQDLYSINYLHFGAPKQWYSIPQSECEKFYNLMKELFSEEYKKCLEFLRHKTFLVSPNFLSKHGVKYNKIVHNEGEFMITYPYGYHAGFNYGYNVAESVNFALDEWFAYAEKARKCECVNYSVGINARQLKCKYEGIPYEEEKDSLVYEEGAAEAPLRRKHNQSRQGSLPNPKKIEYECLLCPINFPKKLTKYNEFSLLDTDLIDESSQKVMRVHALCAQMFPGQLEIDPTLSKVTGLTLISSAQKNLRCSVCDSSLKGKKPAHGACFQCQYPKCVRAFHGTCGLGKGVLYDFHDFQHMCKYHRSKDSLIRGCEKPSQTASIALNSLVQFVVPSIGDFHSKQKELYCGFVTSNNHKEETIEVLVYPSLKDKLEISYRDVIINAIDNEEQTKSLFMNMRSTKTGQQRSKKNNLDFENDVVVTGIASDSNIVHQQDGKYIVEVLKLEQPSVDVSSYEFRMWYYVPEFSSEQVARYTDNFERPSDEVSFKRLLKKVNPNIYQAQKRNIQSYDPKNLEKRPKYEKKEDPTRLQPQHMCHPQLSFKLNGVGTSFMQYPGA